MNLKDLVAGIRLRVIEEGTRTAGISPSPQFLTCKEANNQLRVAYEDMQKYAAAVGRMPPSPGTLRAKASVHLVRLVQRMLFWYTPQVVRFNMAASFFAEQVSLAGEKQIAALEELAGRMAALSTEVRLSAEPNENGDDASRRPPNGEFSSFNAPSDARFDSFVSEYRKRSELSENDRVWYFRELRQMLDLNPGVAGTWIDLECGSGAWMESIRDIHPDIAGVEPNGAEAAGCEARGLRVFRGGTLRFLSETQSPRFAGITALRVLERHTTVGNFHLLRHCARRLLPGGSILITCADPASIIAGASQFWEEPCNLRPVPVETVTAMLDHLDSGSSVSGRCDRGRKNNSFL